MNPFEYAVGLTTIIIGLAIGDMATSLHRLIRHRRDVVWDARVLLLAAWAFVTLIQMWFEFWSIRGRADMLGFPLLLTLTTEFAILFLISASALPDEEPADRDLSDFYERNARAIWLMVALFRTSVLGHLTYFLLGRSDKAALYQTHYLSVLPFYIAPIAIALILARWPRNRALHLAGIGLLLLETLGFLLRKSLA